MIRSLYTHREAPLIELLTGSCNRRGRPPLGTSIAQHISGILPGIKNRVRTSIFCMLELLSAAQISRRDIIVARTSFLLRCLDNTALPPLVLVFALSVYALVSLHAFP